MICTASLAASNPAWLQNALATAVSCASGSPRSALVAARYSRSRAASSRMCMSANFHCSPWNSHSLRPNCSRVIACSRAALNAYWPSASERAVLPMRSALKPAICFLNPPGPSSTFPGGT